jgi:hypothetical protein
MKSIRLLLFLIAAITLSLVPVNAQTTPSLKIVGQWTFTYRGGTRPFQFNEDQTFSGRYPISGKAFAGTWKLEGTKVLLFKHGKSGEFGSITFRMGDETEYAAEGYKMTGHRVKL